MEKLKKVLYSQKAAPYIFVLPFILSFLIFWMYPLFSTDVNEELKAAQEALEIDY